MRVRRFPLFLVLLFVALFMGFFWMASEFHKLSQELNERIQSRRVFNR